MDCESAAFLVFQAIRSGEFGFLSATIATVIVGTEALTRHGSPAYSVADRESIRDLALGRSETQPALEGIASGISMVRSMLLEARGLIGEYERVTSARQMEVRDRLDALAPRWRTSRNPHGARPLAAFGNECRVDNGNLEKPTSTTIVPILSRKMTAILGF
jgi:hypothetical protein